MNLHGITPAHSDVGLRLALEIREFLLSTGAAGGVRFSANRLKASAPDVRGEKASGEGIRATSKDFHGLGDFERSNQIDNGTKNADGVASFFEAGCIRGFHEAGETRRLAGNNGHGDAVARNRRGIDPRGVGLDREIINQETGLEVIGAVENQGKAGKQFDSVPGAEVGNQALDLNIGINGVQLALSGHRLWKGFGGVRFVKQALPLKVGSFDQMATEDAQAANAGRQDYLRGRSADGPAAHQNGTRGAQLLLPFRAKWLKEH